MLKNVRASEVDMSIKEMYQLCTKKKIGTGQVLVEMKRWFGELTFNVTIRMICGKRYFGTSCDCEDDEEALGCQKAVRDFFHLSGLFVVSDTFPFLGWLDAEGDQDFMDVMLSDYDDDNHQQSNLYVRPRTTKSSSNSKRTAPEVAGAWPIIGHLHLFAGKELPHITLGAMTEKYGPIFTIQLGMHRALVVSSWEVVKECFTTLDIAFASHPRVVAFEHMGYNYAMFNAAPYGPYWREMRKIATVELLSNRRLEMLKYVRASEVDMSIKELYELCTKKKNEAGLVLAEMKRWFGDLTFNVAVRMICGKRYFGTNCDCEEEEARRCQKAMRDFFHLSGVFVVSDSFPFLGWLDVGGYERAMKRTGKELDCILQGWLDEHRLKRLSGKSEGDQDFIDVMLSILEDAKLSDQYDADTINKSTSLTLIGGATDTTQVTLTWALSLLLNNRHVLRKAMDELDVHVGRDRHVDESDIKNLVYLQAIVKETLRLYPAAPLAGPRVAREDCTVAGYYVQKGTHLIVNLSKIQRDPRVWTDPSEFQPERFLTSHVEMDVRGQHFEFIPFGSGRRMCPGVSFALQVVHLALASLLHGFDVETLLGAPVDMTEGQGVTNLKATPLEVLLTPRLPSELYGY
ncbi:hypothetical protein HHK36_015056 [Tetracentron sinense]|uniref:Cytochrome P450 n=1 Tax=Tetracentron sinense TaxID=13715 RepID=A0A834Z5G1_TETSI|nr:hypothetical protein HHK36_015056 [Tetracentron sinense]